LQGFLYNQPLLQAEADGHLVVLVHVRLHYNSCDKDLPGLITLKPVAPQYWLKLKRPQAIAEVGGAREAIGCCIIYLLLLHMSAAVYQAVAAAGTGAVVAGSKFSCLLVRSADCRPATAPGLPVAGSLLLQLPAGGLAGGFWVCSYCGCYGCYMML
jgi:hypothetical protein